MIVFQAAPVVRTAYLHPGQLTASAVPCTVTTILGSCVAACLWDVEAGVGGMNHYLLPHHAGRASASPRFGTVALPLLLEKLLALGARRETLRAKLFGGACVLQAMRGDRDHLGQKNVELARQFLRTEGVPVAASDVGGDHGRKLVFDTHDGTARVRLLREDFDEHQ